MKQYQGTPIFPGRVAGPARIITSVKDLAQVQPGDIIVCDRATPLYTRAFKKAVGIIFESGGTLAHATTLAREYQIPCVLGVPDTTTLFKNSTILSIDGATGIVLTRPGPVKLALLLHKRLIGRNITR